ncbi:MAG: sterol desaturase family protein [Methyloligellaceae bacterium]
MSDGAWRLVIFIAVLISLACIELIIPRRELKTAKSHRWFTNLSIAMIGNAAVRLMGMVALPIVAMSAAIYANSKGWGILSNVEMPLWVQIIISVIVLDLAIYLQHVASHHIPFLWRLHKVHHADRDIDVTTAVRFHPGEIVLSMVYKVGLVFVLGPPVFAVFLFEVILSSCAMFNHSNIRLPEGLDRVLRLFIVTPDMHRVHHSVRVNETNSNYGFNISVWDYVFGTYIRQPEDGHEGMRIGLEEYQSPKPTRLGWSLLLPFRADPRGPKGNSEE